MLDQPLQSNRQLDHPNIVRFIESGSHKGAFYFVMELCDGGSLMDLYNKNRGPLSPEQLMPHALKAPEGLANAHSKGFVHRDLKPGTIPKPLAAAIDRSVTKKDKGRYSDAANSCARRHATISQKKSDFAAVRENRRPACLGTEFASAAERLSQAGRLCSLVCSGSPSSLYFREMA